MKRRPKAKRKTIVSQVAGKQTVEEKQALQITGGIVPKSDAEGIVLGWLGVKKFDGEMSAHLPEEKRNWFRVWVEKSTLGYVRQAMTDWEPTKIHAIAKAMRAVKKKWDMDKMGWFLHEASKQGPVNVTKLCDTLAENGTLRAPLRTWQSRAKKLKIETVGIGRPKD